MKSIMFLFAMISIIAASAIRPQVASVADSSAAVPVEGASNQNAAEEREDLDNAETFGFGFHKHVHVHGGYYGGPAYYPHYGGYYPYGGGYGYGYGHPYYY
ncbi:uncharacterized protein LOC129771291 [Toxorhynchites rutilus septentrionalis]|uniref:uncharacterized protein LOC129771291 n=1 Tax=Toxorhynchites rutilus septentrionalis TaxID=329112 RepID=UPI002479DBF5|nr:uncharacterized protein LOC129771291 [Toxorhynchites rutilus septentrionalis]